jgi:hypothetical protein
LTASLTKILFTKDSFLFTYAKEYQKVRYCNSRDFGHSDVPAREGRVSLRG